MCQIANSCPLFSPFGSLFADKETSTREQTASQGLGFSKPWVYWPVWEQLTQDEHSLK